MDISLHLRVNFVSTSVSRSYATVLTILNSPTFNVNSFNSDRTLNDASLHDFPINRCVCNVCNVFSARKRLSRDNGQRRTSSPNSASTYNSLLDVFTPLRQTLFTSRVGPPSRCCGKWGRIKKILHGFPRCIDTPDTCTSSITVLITKHGLARLILFIQHRR